MTTDPKTRDEATRLPQSSVMASHQNGGVEAAVQLLELKADVGSFDSPEMKAYHRYVRFSFLNDEKICRALLSSTDRERKYREALEEIATWKNWLETPTAACAQIITIARSALPTEQDKGWLRTGHAARPASEALAKAAASTAILDRLRLWLNDMEVDVWPDDAAVLRDAVAEIERLQARKDGAYLERNQVVAALASAFPSGITRTAIPGWSDDWHGCVYIDLPTGQASWHYHDSHAHLFAHLPPYAGTWDGHTTEEKYERLRTLSAPSTGTTEDAAGSRPPSSSPSALPVRRNDVRGQRDK